MSISGSDIYLTSIRIAQLSEATEADLRSAASRAYYAAMHVAISAIPTQFAPTDADRKRSDSHVMVVDALTLWANSRTNGRTEAKYLARNLPRLKRTRKSADYEIGWDFSAREATDALELAKKVIDSANTALHQCSAQG